MAAEFNNATGKEPDRSARTLFHVFLVAGLFFFFATVFEAIVALVERRKSRLSPSAWAQRLSALAIGDVVLCLLITSAVAASAFRTGDLRPPRRTLADGTELARPRLGVMKDEHATGRSAHIDGVLPDSPAGRAGLRAGDAIVSAGGARIRSFEQLQRVVRMSSATTALDLDVVRGDERIAIRIARFDEIPDSEANRGYEAARARVDEAKATPKMFEATRPCAGFSHGGFSWLVWWCGLMAVLAAIAIAAGRSGAQAIVLASLALVAAFLGDLATAGVGFALCSAIGGYSVGGAAIAVVFGTTWRLIAGAIARPLIRTRTSLSDASSPHGARSPIDFALVPLIRSPAAFARALLYVLAFGARAFLGISAIAIVVFGEVPWPPSALSGIAHAAAPWLARALFVVSIAILAPIGEELLFRGILLPVLADRIGPIRATLASSAIFAMVHVSTHGVGIWSPFLIALVASWARLKTGSLRAPILLHVLVNAASIAGR